MAHEASNVGLEKKQVERTQHREKLKASEEKIILPEKLKCDSSESSDNSGSDSKSDTKSESGSANEKEVKGVSRGETTKKKKKILKKKMKKETEKNEGDACKDDKLQCDSSDSNSGSEDDSSDSKPGSGHDSKSESGSTKVGFEEVKQMEKKKGLIEKIREMLSPKPKEENAEFTNKAISDMKEENKEKLGKLQCDSSDSKSGSSSDSGSESSSATKKGTRVVKGCSKRDKNKVLKKMIKKKATKKNKGFGDDSGSDSKSESGSSSEKENSKEKRANKEKKKEPEMKMKEPSVKERGEENRTPGTDHEVVLDTKMDTGTTMGNSKMIKAIQEAQDMGKKVKENEVDEQGPGEKKGILGKIMERLASYYKKGGE